jgi:hypothetical protein
LAAAEDVDARPAQTSLRSLRKLAALPGMTVVTVTQRKLRGSLRHQNRKTRRGSVPLPCC